MAPVSFNDVELPFNTIVIESLQLEYRQVLDTVYQRGTINQPRGMKVYDAGFTVLKITQPMMPQLPVQTGRGVNLDIAAIEALQLITGEDRGDLVLKIAPQFERYTNVNPEVEEGEARYFHGNYGGRMNVSCLHDCDGKRRHFSWLECVVQKIKNDRDTRQAVINIWQNERDNKPGMNDYPCTVALIFRIFRGRLDMHVTMRSNDAWKGLPYDVFQFNQAHWTVANMLSVPLGSYYHVATSMHIYDEDTPKIGKVRNRSYVSNVTLPHGFSHVDDAVSIASGFTTIGESESASHVWYASRLAPYVTDENETEE